MYVKLLIANEQLSCLQSINDQFFADSKILIDTVNNSNYDPSSTIADFYNNEFLLASRADIYGFLNGSDEFTYNDSLQRIINEFTKNPEVGVVYFDKYLKKDNNLITQLYPSYEFQEPIIYNPTIFVNGKIDIQLFDKNLKNLLFYDVIQKLGQICRIIHIPEILMTTKFESTDITQELEYYGRKNI